MTWLTADSVNAVQSRPHPRGVFPAGLLADHQAAGCGRQAMRG